MRLPALSRLPRRHPARTIPNPPEGRTGPPSAVAGACLRGIWFADGLFGVKWTPGDPAFRELRELVRTMTGRTWNPDVRHWSIPPTASNAAALADIAERFGFQVQPGAATQLAAIAGHARHRAAASRALEAHFEPRPGLGGVLRPFQKAGVAYAAERQRTWIADEVGLGKTVEALAVLHEREAFPAVVVCPAKLRTVWARHVAEWLPGRTCQVVAGQRPAEAYDADVLILSHDVVSFHADGIIAAGPRALVVDEAHAVKNPRARRTRAVARIAAEAAPPVRLLLTGTPTPNTGMELLPQLRILDRLEELGGEREFKWRFDRPWVAPAELVALHERLREHCYLRRQKRDVWQELPAVERVAVEADISRREYDEAAHELSDARAAILSAQDAAEAAQARAAALGALATMRRACGMAKVPAAIEWVQGFAAESTDSPLIVFAHHVDVQQALADAFDAIWIRAGMTDAELAAAVDEFQSGEGRRIAVVSLGAGGVGLTLTAASHMLIAELPWRPMDLEQAYGRAHGRVSDPHGLTAYHLLAPGTLDDIVEAILNRKLAVTRAVQDGEIVAADAGSLVGELLDAVLGLDRAPVQS